MTPVNAISIVYVFMALASIGVLSYTFRKKIDTSGKLFLLAEVVFIPTVVIINLAHQNPYYKSAPFLLIANGAYLFSEVLIFLSIYALGRATRPRAFFATLSSAATFFAFTEYMRSIDPLIPTLLYPVGYTIIAFGTFLVCATCDVPVLKDNPFLKWLQYIEASLFVANLLRILSFFLIEPVAPFEAQASSILFVAFVAIVNISRYVSYQSLRISWVGSGEENENFLNRTLAQNTYELERLRETLISSNRLLSVGALASSVAHELSQPLTSAALQTEAVKRDLLLAGVDPSFLATINKVSVQLNRISNQLKKLRQLFSAKNGDFRLFSLHDTCDEVIDLVRSTKHLGSIDLNVTYQDRPVVYGDPIQIQQVLINVIDNALAAIGDGGSREGTISITIRQDDAFAQVTIEDTGPGIPGEILPMIFELYKTTKSQGAGIGLWLSKIIMDDHRGAIVATNRPGSGAAFELRIPLGEQLA